MFRMCGSLTASFILLLIMSVSVFAQSAGSLRLKIAPVKSESYCMGLAIYHEARGETLIGQIMVAATILNRARSSAYPDTVCGVVFHNQHRFNACQFSFTCDGLSDFPKNKDKFEELITLGEIVMSDSVPNFIFDGHLEMEKKLNNVTHYHRYDINTSWSKKLGKIGQFGDHVFFKSNRVIRRYRSDTQIVKISQPKVLASAVTPSHPSPYYAFF